MGGTAKKKTKVSRSVRAGLQFSVGRIHRMLKSGRYAKRISSTASVYLAAVAEYLTAEVLEVSSSVAVHFKKRRIAPRHLMLACRSDEDLSTIFQGVIFANSGVVPNIEKALIPQNNKKGVPPPQEIDEDLTF